MVRPNSSRDFVLLSRPFVVLAVSISMAAFTLAACSDESTPDDVVEFNVLLTSQERVLYEVGPAAETVYGWNRLTGPAEVDGRAATVELLGSVDYVNGSGEFFGFVTVVFEDGSSLGLRLTDGRTTAATDAANAKFTSPMRLMGGTGQYADVEGTGEFEGEREDTLGGVVDGRIRVELTRLDP